MDDNTRGSKMTMTSTILLISGFIGGGIIAWLFASRKAKSLDAVNEELRQQIEEKNRTLSETQREVTIEKQTRAALEAKYQEAEKNIQTMETKLSEKFKSLSLEALSSNSAEFLKLAQEKLASQTINGKKELESKKELIDKNIEAIDKRLIEVKQKIGDVNERNIEVSTLIKKHEDVTSKLRDTTDHLKQVLASSKKRGEWGERMAEDIIKLVGMIDGVNYIKQKTLEDSSGRPDYTFLMPNNLKINMDVKFPLDNYIHYLNSESEHERKRYKEELIRNTKTMIKNVTTRDYIDPNRNTVDYVIVFIPNEQVYNFIHEVDSTIMDDALRQKVILCSPFTLYAVLAVIRQAIENFNLERTASEILGLLGDFSKQWGAYKDKFRLMGERLDAAKKEYDILVTTRSNMLERPLKKIEELRKQETVEIKPDPKYDSTKILE